MSLQQPTVWDDDVEDDGENQSALESPAPSENSVDTSHSRPPKRVKLEEQSNDNDDYELESKTPAKHRRSYTRFNPKWTTQFIWIIRSERGPLYAFCQLCNSDISISSGGKNDVTRHLKSARHTTKEKHIDKGCIPKSVPETQQKEYIVKMKEELKMLEDEEEELRKNDELRELQQKIHEKEISIKKLKIGAVTVAFTAVISKHLSNLGQKQPIVFDELVTNVGSAYNHNTGMFTAPVCGVYSFTIDLMEAAGEHLYTEVVKDGKHVIWHYCHAVGSQHYVSASRTLVLQLETGNQVWVRVGDMQEFGSGKLWGNGFSSFTGCLITRTK